MTTMGEIWDCTHCVPPHNDDMPHSKPPEQAGGEFEAALTLAIADAMTNNGSVEKMQAAKASVASLRAAHLGALRLAERHGTPMCGRHDGVVFNRPAGVCAGCLIEEAAEQRGFADGSERDHAIVEKMIEAARREGAVEATKELLDAWSDLDEARLFNAVRKLAEQRAAEKEAADGR